MFLFSAFMYLKTCPNIYERQRWPDEKDSAVERRHKEQNAKKRASNLTQRTMTDIDLGRHLKQINISYFHVSSIVNSIAGASSEYTDKSRSKIDRLI